MVADAQTSGHLLCGFWVEYCLDLFHFQIMDPVKCLLLSASGGLRIR